jgi:hypothetical protein
MTHSADNDAPRRRLFHAIKDCGGCAGLGAHRRWCPYAVGETAAYFGQLSEKAESLGDAIGPNDMGAANMAWQVAAILRQRAEDARVTPPEEPTPEEWAEFHRRMGAKGHTRPIPPAVTAPRITPPTEGS